MKAVVGSKDEILSQADIKLIFSNITQIATIHQHDLLDKLHASAKAWPSANNIGEIFLQFVCTTTRVVRTANSSGYS
jgi:hypothetical protein